MGLAAESGCSQNDAMAAWTLCREFQPSRDHISTRAPSQVGQCPQLCGAGDAEGKEGCSAEEWR